MRHTVLSEKYEALYRVMLATYGARWPEECPSMTAFWPMVGCDYDAELMVVGRAPNGWSDEVLESLVATNEGVEHVARQARSDSEGTGRCPMLWVSDQATSKADYNTNTSAFWRVARNVAAAIHRLPADAATLPSRLAWSNLYKLAPHKERNPSDAACNAQWPGVANLLAQEVEELAPARVLVMAGKQWAKDFDEQLKLGIEWTRGSDDAHAPVAGVADAIGARWVVAAHPERKSDQPIIDAALAAFR